MGLISIELPDDAEKSLSQEARNSRRTKSELALEAILAYLQQSESERDLANLETAAKKLAEHPQSRHESLRIAEEFLIPENEIQDTTDRHALAPDPIQQVRAQVG